ncbi:MAG: ATP-binding protein [Myxococcota bacterium]
MDSTRDTPSTATAPMARDLAAQPASITRLFGGLMDAAPDGMLICDASGVILVANAQAEKMLGYDAGELVGKPIETLTPPSLRDQHVRHRTQYAARPQTRRMGIGMELVAVRKDGSEIPAEVSLRPLDTAEGAFVVSAFRDVTERRQSEELLRHQASALARSNEALQQFAYVASHDLQEPLRMVSSYLQLLERRYGDQLDADAKDFIGFAVDGAKRMQALINDLLAYSRVGRTEAPHVKVDLGEVVRRVLEDLAVAVRESGAVVHVDRLPMVVGDAPLLGQVFQNLVANALKFQRPGVPPEVWIEARRDDAGWTIAVRDAGIGLEPKYADRIFQIFQRLHTRAEYPGTGIGLAIVKRIVEEHGGVVRVESVPGAGATFSFTLPDRRRSWATP